MLRARLLLVSLLTIAVFAAPAQAADTVLAPATATAGVTAHDGHVVLSRLDAQTGRWALVRWHAGVVDVLPVAQRPVPFDADVGSDRSGRPVVVYSRCTTEPQPGGGGLAPAPDWQTARGCDLYTLALAGPLVERRLTAASSRGASETTPSMWRGALAFARHADGGSVPSILFLAAGSNRSRRLGGGSVQTCSGAGLCGVDRRHDGIDQLDLGPSRAAYVWRMTGGAVYGTGIVWELRAAPTAGGRSILLDSGLISGACGFRLPSAPSASSSPIAYLAASAKCDVTTTSFALADPVTGEHAEAVTQGGLAAGAARDGRTIYWLRASAPAGNLEAATPVPGFGSCGLATAHCQLVASPLPAYTPAALRGQAPQAQIDPVRSDQGYSWVRGPAGTRLLRPPPRVPCAPSKQVAYVTMSAQWSRGRHTVRVLRQDTGHPARAIGSGSPQKRSYPTGIGITSRLRSCGDRARFIYAVTTNGRTQRVSFSVTRAGAPA